MRGGASSSSGSLILAIPRWLTNSNISLDCQWIDITDVPVGNYILRLHANPDLTVAETDYYNNVAVCNLIYEPQRLYTFNCHIPDDYESEFIEQFYTERAYGGKVFEIEGG